MRPAWQRSRQIAARYASKCRECSVKVQPGDSVWYAKGAGVRCWACGRHPAPGQPATAVPKTVPESFTFKAGPQARKDADGVYRYTFDSLAAAVKHARSAKAQTQGNQATIIGALRNSDITPETGAGPGDRWTNHYNYMRLAEDAADPPAHLLAAVDGMRQKMIDRIAPPQVTRRRLRRGRDWGDDIDGDRFLARDPMMWNRVEREPTAKRTVTIGCNLSVAAKQKPDELLWRGAAALALADVLTQRGINVGIVLFESCHKPTSTVANCVVRYVAKDPQMPLDVGALTFAMCEIAWFRLVAVIGKGKLLPGRLKASFGGADTMPEADKRGLDFIIDSNAIGQTGAVRWLEAAINKVKESTYGSSTEAA